MDADRDDTTGWRERLSIVIPAHNEVEAIPSTLASIREAIPECEVIVVDDGSTDGTAEAVARFDGVRLVRHPFNRGYGASLKSGMERAEREFIAWFDADGEHRVEDVMEMARRLDEERLVAVIGQRKNPGRSVVRATGKFGIRLLARSLGVRAGADFNCGLRVFRSAVILSYRSLLPDGFSASMTSTMIMLARRYPIAFQPVTVKPRVGASKVALLDGFASLMLVLRMMMLFAPLRIFLGMGSILLLLGTAYGLTTAVILGLGLPTAALLLMNAGMMLCMLGLIADQISQIRLREMDRLDPAANRPDPSPRQDE